MPTPLEILLDPISLSIIAMYALLMIIEALFPARQLPAVKYWIPRGIAAFIIYFYLEFDGVHCYFSCLIIVTEKVHQPS